MSCPFKYEREVLTWQLFRDVKIGLFKSRREIVDEGTETELLCKLNHFECVGESKCPIMKK